MSMADKYEELALWYLRLNGYLTVPNFILHPIGRGPQRGEVDILGVRFPYSVEEVGEIMVNDKKLIQRDKKIDFIIAEVKRNECKLNRPWTEANNKERREYVLKWLGMIPPDKVACVAEKLYREKEFKGKEWAIRLVCLGRKKSDLPEKVTQLTFRDVLEFIRKRFKQFERSKIDCEQWDPFIKQLFQRITSRKQGDGEILNWLDSTSAE